MYILIAGRHPLLENRSVDYDSYIEMLKNKPEIKYPEELGFTKLSISLISWMLEY